jgi:hypothetical protein
MTPEQCINYLNREGYCLWVGAGVCTKQIKKLLGISRLEVSRLAEILSIPDGGDLADWLPANAIIPDVLTKEPLPF